VQANSRNNQLAVASGPENHTVGALPRGTSSSKAKHQTHLSNNDLIMQNVQNSSHLISQIKHQPTGSVVVQPAGQGVEQQFSNSQLDQNMTQPSRNTSQGLGGVGMAQQQFKSDFPQHGKWAEMCARYPDNFGLPASRRVLFFFTHYLTLTKWAVDNIENRWEFITKEMNYL
jgi:hypothetical protein